MQPEILFDEEAAMEEGKLVYMVLMDVLQGSAFKVQLSARKLLPRHVAEVLYIREDQSQVKEDEIK